MTYLDILKVIFKVLNFYLLGCMVISCSVACCIRNQFLYHIDVFNGTLVGASGRIVLTHSMKRSLCDFCCPPTYLGEWQYAVRKDLCSASSLSSLTTFSMYFRTLLFTIFIIVGMFINFFLTVEFAIFLSRTLCLIIPRILLIAPWWNTSNILFSSSFNDHLSSPHITVLSGIVWYRNFLVLLDMSLHLNLNNSFIWPICEFAIAMQVLTSKLSLNLEVTLDTRYLNFGCEMNVCSSSQLVPSGIGS
jgi:hypothetical protein